MLSSSPWCLRYLHPDSCFLFIICRSLSSNMFYFSSNLPLLTPSYFNLQTLSTHFLSNQKAYSLRKIDILSQIFYVDAYFLYNLSLTSLLKTLTIATNVYNTLHTTHITIANNTTNTRSYLSIPFRYLFTLCSCWYLNVVYTLFSWE